MTGPEIVTFLKTQAHRPGAPPYYLTAGRRDLAAWCRTFRFTCGAEIGVWAGHFSEQLCTANPGLALTCVDPWAVLADYRERKNDATKLTAAYTDAVARLAPFACRLLRMPSIEAAGLVPDGSLDFVYIDANHAKACVEADLRAWVPKVRSGGVIAGHDYELRPKSAWIDVRDVVDAYTSQHGIAPWFVLTGDKSPSYCWVQA